MRKHPLLISDRSAPGPYHRRRASSDEDERDELKQGDVLTAEGRQWHVSAFEYMERHGSRFISAYWVEPHEPSG
jgi:hypothetical protein